MSWQGDRGDGKVRLATKVFLLISLFGFVILAGFAIDITWKEGARWLIEGGMAELGWRLPSFVLAMLAILIGFGVMVYTGARLWEKETSCE